MFLPNPFWPFTKNWVEYLICSQVETDPSASVQLCRILFRPLSRPGQAQARETAYSDTYNTDPWGKRPTRAVHALNRPVDGHRKAGSVGTPSYETLTVGGQ